MWRSYSDDIPDVLCCVTELAACNTGTEGEVADRDRVILVLVGEAIVTLGHGSNEDANALLRTEVGHVITHSHHRGIERQSDLAAVGRKVVGDGVLDDFEQLFLRGGGANRQFVQELNHKTGETLESTRNAHCRRNLDEHALGGVDVDLKPASLVDGRIQQSQETLVGDIGTRIRDVAVHLAHDSNVLITVEQRVFVILHAVAATVRGLVRLETGVGEDDNQALGVLVAGGDGHMLLRDELRECGRWERLCLGACGVGRSVVSHCKDLVER